MLVERCGQQVGGLGVPPGRERDQAGVVAGQRGQRGRIETFGHLALPGAGGQRVVVAPEPGQQMGAGGQAGQGDDRDAAGGRNGPVGQLQRGR